MSVNGKKQLDSPAAEPDIPWASEEERREAAYQRSRVRNRRRATRRAGTVLRDAVLNRIEGEDGEEVKRESETSESNRS